jgi:molybdopterin converting factor small subunit
MALFVPHPDLAKLLGLSTLRTPAATIRELLIEIRARGGPAALEQARRSTFLVNGRGIAFLRGLDTTLGEEDEVWAVLPAGGG